MTRRLFRAGFAAQSALVVAIAAAAYAGVLPTTLSQFPHADLLAHAVLIGLLAFFLDGALGLRAVAGFVRVGPALVLACAAVEEYAQRFSPRRTSSWSDFAADVVGVVFFAWLAGRVYRPA
jgi:VanZ family protein